MAISSPRVARRVKGRARKAVVSAVLVAGATAVLRRRWGQGLRGFLIHEADRRAVLEQSMAEVKPAVVLLDLALPGLGGFGGVLAIQRLNPAAKIIVLARTPHERQAVFALLAGARGYCDRGIGPSLIRKATALVQRGEIWIARGVVPLLLKRLTALTQYPRDAERSGPESPFEALAPREREVAELVGGGANNKEIATQLSVTEATVKAHLTSCFRKLHVADRLRLALIVTEHRNQLRGESDTRPRSN